MGVPPSDTRTEEERLTQLEEQLEAFQRFIAVEVTAAFEKAVTALQQALDNRFGSSLEEVMKQQDDELVEEINRQSTHQLQLQFDGEVNRSRERQESIKSSVKVDQLQFQSDVRSTLTTVRANKSIQVEVGNSFNDGGIGVGEGNSNWGKKGIGVGSGEGSGLGTGSGGGPGDGNRTDGKRNEASSYIPDGLINNILLRLPVKPLLRFRCVSKPWCSLIDSSKFIKEHLRRNIENYPDSGIIVREPPKGFSTEFVGRAGDWDGKVVKALTGKRARVGGIEGKRVLETTVEAGILFIVPRFFVVSSDKHGYAVVDLEILNSMKINNLCLSRFVKLREDERGKFTPVDNYQNKVGSAIASPVFSSTSCCSAFFWHDTSKDSIILKIIRVLPPAVPPNQIKANTATWKRAIAKRFSWSLLVGVEGWDDVGCTQSAAEDGIVSLNSVIAVLDAEFHSLPSTPHRQQYGPSLDRIKCRLLKGTNAQEVRAMVLDMQARLLLDMLGKGIESALINPSALVSLQVKLIPINIDKRFKLLRGCPGFHSSANYEHSGSTDWPAFSIGETRIAIKLYDPGGYWRGAERPKEPGLKSLRTSRALLEGMVGTVEPGCYFMDALLIPAMKRPNTSKFLSSEISQFRGFGGVRIESDLTFVGLVGLRDPPREAVHQAMEDCRAAGINVMVITGDNNSTAEAVCHGIGVFGAKEDIRLTSLTGKEFMQLENPKAHLRQFGGFMFSRAQPKHKQEIVRLLKEIGEVGALTGDGVNDAPAQNLAEIGMAMGFTATEIAKGASDIVLADDSFTTIVAARGEGRSICNNVTAFISNSLKFQPSDKLLMKKPPRRSDDSLGAYTKFVRKGWHLLVRSKSHISYLEQQFLSSHLEDKVAVWAAGIAMHWGPSPTLRPKPKKMVSSPVLE